MATNTPRKVRMGEFAEFISYVTSALTGLCSHDRLFAQGFDDTAKMACEIAFTTLRTVDNYYDRNRDSS